jgi:hypothetical protein
VKLLLGSRSWKYHNISLILERKKFWKMVERKREGVSFLERRRRKLFLSTLERESEMENEYFVPKHTYILLTCKST